MAQRSTSRRSPADPADVRRRLVAAGATGAESEALEARYQERLTAYDPADIDSKLRDRVALDVISERLAVLGAEGDRAAAERLVDIWQHHVLRWCKFHATGHDVPEDAAHDVLVTVLTQVDRVRDPARFRAWLWGVTWRTLRARGRKPWFKWWVLGPVDEKPDPVDNAETAVGRSKQADLVTEVLQGMRAEHRELLWLHYAEGMSRREMTEVLSMPEGTLNRKLTAARRAFELRARRVGLAPEGA
jgi:RNA polymerase sigma factor (sigma-70 family)